MKDVASLLRLLRIDVGMEKGRVAESAECVYCGQW